MMLQRVWKQAKPARMGLFCGQQDLRKLLHTDDAPQDNEQGHERFDRISNYVRYPNHFPVTMTVKDFNAKYDGLPAKARETDDPVSLAGRITSIRSASKKLVFLDISNDGHDVQVLAEKKYFQGDDAANNDAEFEHVHESLRRGDIIGIHGFPGKSGKGELSIIPRGISVLSPCVIRHIRRYLEDLDFIEVETPILCTSAGGAAAKPFTTESRALSTKLYLRIAPELYLKQLVIGGMDRVFEIGKVFRNEGDLIAKLLDICHRHNVPCPAPHTAPRILDCLVGHFLEPQCTSPTFLIDHPVVLSPLAKAHRDNVRPFECINVANELELIRYFFNHVKELNPHIFVTYNGDFFDWPFLETRAQHHGMDLKSEVGISKDRNGEYRGQCAVHLDAYCWVKRDSYLPQGSQGLKAVTKYKLGYDPVEVDPEEMLPLAQNEPLKMASYSVSDAVATFYLYVRFQIGLFWGIDEIAN
ncbi:hypothetical protein DYB34_012230 [Aphanomyces astaci]|uniref:lysine--tRNA ligase n=1 Tax=Aphanomyces astaci TaxID=112090 RepID=A0A3R6VMG2_APHAT|nr:hypothetical protein DYB34_012230 [Aphanomyces astaci]